MYDKIISYILTMKTNCGTLTDQDIKKMCTEGNLVTNNYNKLSVKQACYELRAGHTYYDISNNNKKITISKDEYILLKPKQIIVIITFESLNIPSNFIGRISAKGALFTLGITPINTYADPGFFGNLGLVMNNQSNNYIKIKPKEAIAKIEFSKLENSVESTYHGQHGYQTGVWPIRSDLILSADEIKTDKRIFETAKELELSYGDGLGKVISRVFRFERLLLGSAVLYLIFMMCLIGFMVLKGVDGELILSPVISIISGVVASAVFSILTWFGTNLRRK